MTVETKYYCDECGKEVTGRAVTIAVLVTSGFHEMPGRFDIQEFASIPYQFKQVYNKFLCYDCIGEGIQEYWGGEGGRDFNLKEAGRRFLIKFGFLKPKPSRHSSQNE